MPSSRGTPPCPVRPTAANRSSDDPGPDLSPPSEQEAEAKLELVIVLGRFADYSCVRIPDAETFRITQSIGNEANPVFYTTDLVISRNLRTSNELILNMFFYL